MTLEFSLRKRSVHAKYASVAWMCVCITIFSGSFFLLPYLGDRLFLVNAVISDGDAKMIDVMGMDPGRRISSLIILSSCILSLAGAFYISARMALVEKDISVRLSGIADGLCLAGDDLVKFEKIASVLIPRTQSMSAIPSTKELQPLLSLLKELK